ncbi:hypothetical protein ABFS82_13G075300 [Erythranthe guttata]|uniref:F-box/FBD/LRR-repeat protein At2g26030-like n=1 Tax=Erythranthe guttata TaxID=4155 RepID=UPI00064E0499|nr:PREDICTED: F-box/FBD/LRR-repeat protein At2g26030-like [Erythranthe guttata]|eukprot:XP_012848729.1 PREDICTED: F-box/FBD/LRR-repeat protein At2g26030-like [Erythranthe guttata]
MAITEQHSRRRRGKHPQGETNPSSIDRLSDLPDSVLTHILSFLPTNLSVRTSILGQRWRFLWAYVPTLDFHDENQEIINRVMLLRRVQTINTFRLHFYLDCSAYQLETWFTFAIMRGVQKLDLSLAYEEDTVSGLPGCIFTCETLVDLSLYYCGGIPASGAVCLPRLKILRLISVQYEADESLPHLLSGCPVLEDLEIRLESDMVTCNVSSPTVKRLVLDFLYEGCCSYGRSDRLEIDNTPALEYLEINNCSSEHIKCGVLNSLIKAEIGFYKDEKKQDYYLYSRTVLEFFDRLCNVECLKLDLSYGPDIMDSVLSAWTTNFRNLRKLELHADCRFLPKFLENADNLETLIFTEHWEEIEGWMEPRQQVPTCLLSNLRIINIENIQGQKHEFEAIRYFLRNSKVLERMKISYSRRLFSSNKEINMLKKISTFERGSTACQVEFLLDR